MSGVYCYKIVNIINCKIANALQVSLQPFVRWSFGYLNCIYFYSWAEIGTAKIKCCAQDHNTFYPGHTRTMFALNKRPLCLPQKKKTDELSHCNIKEESDKSIFLDRTRAQIHVVLLKALCVTISNWILHDVSELNFSSINVVIHLGLGL